MNQQKIFNFSLKNNYSDDDYFVSKSNELAFKVLLNQDNSEKYIYLKGPSKSGKSHQDIIISLTKAGYEFLLHGGSNHGKLQKRKP